MQYACGSSPVASAAGPSTVPLRWSSPAEQPKHAGRTLRALNSKLHGTMSAHRNDHQSTADHKCATVKKGRMHGALARQLANLASDGFPHGLHKTWLQTQLLANRKMPARCLSDGFPHSPQAGRACVSCRACQTGAPSVRRRQWSSQALAVPWLMAWNSRSPRNVAYFCGGFPSPVSWLFLDLPAQKFKSQKVGRNPPCLVERSCIPPFAHDGADAGHEVVRHYPGELRRRRESHAHWPELIGRQIWLLLAFRLGRLLGGAGANSTRV